MSTFEYEKVLVSTQWVFHHLNDPNVRLLEVGWDTSEFEAGHIPNAVACWTYSDIEQGVNHPGSLATARNATLIEAVDRIAKPLIGGSANDCEELRASVARRAAGVIHRRAQVCCYRNDVSDAGEGRHFATGT